MINSVKLPAKDIGSDEVYNDGVQSPSVSAKGKPRKKALRDEAQCFAVYDQLETDNRHRTSINAEVVSRHTGKPPHDPKVLEAHAQNWRSNFPTLSLMGIESRITARLVNTIDNLRTLTNSRLPESIDDHDAKSKRFQDRLTSYVRRWTGWRPFVSQLWSEVVLIGYGCVGLLDDYNWRPRLFRSDEAFLPQGCPQFAEYVQIAGLKQSFMIHEAVAWIENGPDVADVAGYQFDNVIESVNHATPKNPLWDQPGQGNVSRAYQDLVREGNLGMSYSTGAKGINVAHVLAIEPEKDADGKQVTHYMIDRDNAHKALLIRENRFKSMKDAICLFTLEPGNSTYYGSKGLGRKCVNITTAMDVAANDAVDAYRLSALGTLVTDAKSGMNAQFEIKNPFVIVKTDGELQQKQTFNFNAEGFKALYAQLGMILENSVGEYLPNIPADPIDPTKKSRTATGERIDFQREQEQSIAFIARGLGQFFDMMQSIQNKISDFETDDEDALAFQKDLMEIDHLTQEEIQMLAKANTAEVVQDLASQKNQQFDQVAQKYMNSPFVNQLKLVRGDISALTSPQVAEDLILPEQIDPTVAAEQVRQQIIENAAIQIGDSVPISPRDDDKEHLQVIIGEFGKAMQGIQKKQATDEDLPGILDNLNALSVHGGAHISSWLKKSGGRPTPEIQQYEQKLKSLDVDLTKLASLLQKVKSQQQMDQQKLAQQSQTPLVLPPGAQPPSQNGQAQPQGQGEPQEPNYGGMSERVTTAWIGQYPNLPDAEKRKLESKAGLGALEPQESQSQPTAPQPPASTVSVVPTG
jgi:hypothetical protein